MEAFSQAHPLTEPQHGISQLNNGLTVVSFPMPWLHEVGVTILTRSGSRFELEREAGIAHFLEHMLFKGTKRIPDPTELHTRLEALAADMNAATGPESNLYWLNVPPIHLEESLTLFSELFTEPALLGIENERQVILAEMREDENEAGENTHPFVLASDQLWKNHPLGRSVLGTREAVESLQVADLQRFLAKHYRGDNMAIAFFGPVEHSHVHDLANKCLGALPSGPGESTPPPPAMPKGPHWLAVNDPTAQLSISLFFRAAGQQDPAHFYPTAAMRRLLDDGFASRLQAQVREKKGLVYDLWAAYSAYTDTGTLEIGASVSPENLDNLFSNLIHQLDKLRHEPASEEEWKRLMTRWYAALGSSLDRPSELVERYVSDHLFRCVEPVTDSWQRVLQLTPQQVQSQAELLLQPENLVVVLVGPNAEKHRDDLQARFTETLAGWTINSSWEA
ncbi:M16 family metallopeptidase [Magnetococcus sp. PR-3]|uniref:M16 family metallopeptidase n=1 Tax=Magnetococcus sp. PR-3 TaxID=3120355 RepID=UPI002FCE5412